MEAELAFARIELSSQRIDSEVQLIELKEDLERYRQTYEE